MPQRLRHPCSYPGCPGLTNECFCPAHTKAETRRYEQERGSAASRGYGARWRRIRIMVLAEEPLCRECAKQGRVEAAMDVHHLDGNVQNMAQENLEPLCHECHSRRTVEENGRWGVR